MLQMDNQTPFETMLGVFCDERRVDAVYPVVKATFTIGDPVRVAAVQVPVVMADEYRGDPGTSSLRYASDMTLTKPAADVYLLGHAYAPRGRETTQVDVKARVGRSGIMARVFGDRIWLARGMGYTISEPRPFERMPLIYERSFGGTDLVGSDERYVEIAENPVGTGYHHARGKSELVGMPLPNIEDPVSPIRDWTDKPKPVGFGALGPGWSPRRNYAGTYDENWETTRAPHLPDDFDLRFCNAASPGLLLPGYLEGDEEVELLNADPTGRMAFRIPRIRLVVSIKIDGDVHVHTPVIDTLTIEPDEHRFTLVWRCKQTVDKRLLRVRVVTFAIQEVDTRVAGL